MYQIRLPEADTQKDGPTQDSQSRRRGSAGAVGATSNQPGGQVRLPGGGGSSELGPLNGSYYRCADGGSEPCIFQGVSPCLYMHPKELSKSHFLEKPVRIRCPPSLCAPHLLPASLTT